MLFGILPLTTAEAMFAPVHAYWDDFSALRGIGDGASCAGAG